MVQLRRMLNMAGSEDDADPAKRGSGAAAWKTGQQITVNLNITTDPLKLDKDNVFKVIAAQEAMNAYVDVTRGGG